MKKLVALVAIIGLWTGVALAGGPITWGHSNPGFMSYVNTPAFKSIQVQSHTTQPNKAVWGYIKKGVSYSAYKATFTGTSGYAKGSTTITKTPGRLSITSKAHAYSTSVNE